MPSNVEEHILKLRDNFSGKLGGANKKVNRFRGNIEKTQNSVSGLGSAIGRAFTGFALAAVGRDIIKVGSNFEQLQISFETMLGSAEKATELIKDLTDFAIKTPFELQDVSKGAKALLAFGIANEKIIPSLRSLGDVAAGLSVPIGRLILNFGQVKTQGKLTGRELRDFAIAGVPLLQELANVLGKSTAEVTELVSKGEVGFPAVEQAFANMSGEGGKFFNLMQKQTASTGGQISNLRDVVSLLENDIFIKLQPTLNLLVEKFGQFVSFLRDNIDGVIRLSKLIAKLGGAFVIYKAILIATSLATKAARIAMVAYRIAVVVLNKGILTAIRSLRLMKVALVSSGIGLLALALAEIASSFIDFGDEISGATEELDKFGNKIDEITAKAGGAIFHQQFRDLLDPLSSGVLGDFGIQQFANQLKGLSKIQLQSFKLFLDEEESTLNRSIANLEEGRKKQGALVDLADVIRSKKLVGAELSKFGGAGAFGGGGKGGGKGDKLKSGLATVRSGAPKNITINIDSLIEEQVFNTANLKESASTIKDAVTRVLLEAVVDAQVIAR